MGRESKFFTKRCPRWLQPPLALHPPHRIPTANRLPRSVYGAAPGHRVGHLGYRASPAPASAPAQCLCSFVGIRLSQPSPATGPSSPSPAERGNGGQQDRETCLLLETGEFGLNLSDLTTRGPNSCLLACTRVRTAMKGCFAG